MNTTAKYLPANSSSSLASKLTKLVGLRWGTPRAQVSAATCSCSCHAHKEAPPAPKVPPLHQSSPLAKDELRDEGQAAVQSHLLAGCNGALEGESVAAGQRRLGCACESRGES